MSQIHQNKSGWPQWPTCDQEKVMVAMREVIDSNRWSVRGSWTGKTSKEEEFSEMFCKFNNCRYTVLTTSGTTGLSLALDALDIGPGDEVIVPALTWIAPITSILNVGATPVLVDVDSNTTCIDPDKIVPAITNATKAIIAVHLHCSLANMDKIMEIAKAHALNVIEDCSQAHGALWGEKRVGTIGDIGVYSLNQEKVLCCGEGGAVITNDQLLYEKLCRIKTDGCAFDWERKILGCDQLIYENAVMGGNCCISEFQSALLIQQLQDLDAQNQARLKNAQYLDTALSDIQGLYSLTHHAKANRRTYYEYGIRVNLDEYDTKDLTFLCDSLSAKLGFPLHQTDAPVYRSPLFTPGTRKRFQHYWESNQFACLNSDHYPNCELLHRSLIVFHHSILLGTLEQMEQIVHAFQELAGVLRQTHAI